MLTRPSPDRTTAEDAQVLHDSLLAVGVPIPVAPSDGPFGRTFTFTDPDGHVITIHHQARPKQA